MAVTEAAMGYQTTISKTKQTWLILIITVRFPARYMNPLLIHGYKNILDKTSIFKVHRNSSAAFLNTKIER